MPLCSASPARAGSARLRRSAPCGRHALLRLAQRADVSHSGWRIENDRDNVCGLVASLVAGCAQTLERLTLGAVMKPFSEMISGSPATAAEDEAAHRKAAALTGAEPPLLSLPALLELRTHTAERFQLAAPRLRLLDIAAGVLSSALPISGELSLHGRTQMCLPVLNLLVHRCSPTLNHHLFWLPQHRTNPLPLLLLLRARRRSTRRSR